MRRLVSALAFLLCLGTSLHAAQRFGRPVIPLEDPKDYQLFKLDDVSFPMLSDAKYSVSCLVYRGTEYYYIEVAIQNRSSDNVIIPPEFIEFAKPGYTVFRVNTMAVAAELARASGERFVPTPPPQMPANSTTTTNINANATTYGNTTQINGTATSTTYDTSGQAGANFGNALGNAIAARRFYRAQREAISLANYLATFAWADTAQILKPGETRVITETFQQTKPKKAHFQVAIHVGDETFAFKYKE